MNRISHTFPHETQNTTEGHPLCHPAAAAYFEECSVVGGESGWDPIYFYNDHVLLPGYIKGHSYGEFIFDWAWADLYHRCGIDYYPKLIHATPFSPVVGPKAFGEEDKKQDIFEHATEYYFKENNFNSHHWLFVDEQEYQFISNDYSEQLSIQYHFQNIYESFDHFLSMLKKDKRKKIKSERSKVKDYGLQFEVKNGLTISSDELNVVYRLYLNTISKKYSNAYLNEEFFSSLNQLGEKVQIRLAKLDEKILAMALFFKSESALYGRYWGILPEFEAQYPLLHFDLCYYQAMEYCMNENLTLFEAGAQGEHKLFRGFRPTLIKSYHHLKHQQLFEVIKEHLVQQNKKIVASCEKLERFLPFKIPS